jgi:copper chaperone
MATVKIKGMSCAHCVGAVTEALQKIDGITGVQVSLEKGEAQYQESKPVPLEVIKNAVSKIGFEVV